MVDLQIIRVGRNLIKEGISLVKPILQALMAPKGTSFSNRLKALRQLIDTIFSSARDHRPQAKDPLTSLREELSDEPQRLKAIETGATRQVEAVLSTVFPQDV